MKILFTVSYTVFGAWRIWCVNVATLRAGQPRSCWLISA